MRVILASASPRRRELMAQAGFDFTVIPATGEEDAGNRPPEEAVRFLAAQKAREVAGRIAADPEKAPDPGEQVLVIGADTVVSLDGRVLGKPKDRTEAAKMLRGISGRTHEVFTGVAVIALFGGVVCRETVFSERTEVDVEVLSDEEIDVYLETGESYDKAGAYGLQGRFAVHVRAVRGDYCNVIGLPLAALYRCLKEHFFLQN